MTTICEGLSDENVGQQPTSEIERGRSIPATDSPTLGFSSMLKAKSMYSLATMSVQSSLTSGASSDSSYETGIVVENLPDSFARDLKEYTDASPDAPLLNHGLRKILEPHLRPARRRRDMARKARTEGRIQDSIASSWGLPYTELRQETPFLFSEETHPLDRILAECLGVRDLSSAHHIPEDSLLRPLLDRQTRIPFHLAYENFVTSFCIPFVHTIALSKGLFHSGTSGRIVYRYQSFPHVNAVRPGFGSESPTTSTARGKSIGSLSFHVPLTPSFGTNALHTESHPGREDWHTLSAKSFGLGYMFDAARCIHYTMENTTDSTRVSLDFSILIYSEDEVSSGMFGSSNLCPPHLLEDSFSDGGSTFYSEVAVELGQSHRQGEGIVKRKSKVYLSAPDGRVGHPFS